LYTLVFIPEISDFFSRGL